jgi:alpha-galactosidase
MVTGVPATGPDRFAGFDGRVVRYGASLTFRANKLVCPRVSCQITGVIRAGIKVKFGRATVAGLLALAITLPLSAQTNATNPAPPAPLPVSLTPPSPATPQIHSAKIFGVRPGHPFLYTIAATGDRPMTFAADGLPEGLKLDAANGQITGSVSNRGSYEVILHARNSLGDATRPLRIVVGDNIALTPPMGWNSWNCFGPTVTEEKVKAAADTLVSSGLANHGWTYINVDDFWQVKPGSTDPSLQGPERDAQGNILPNPRFPDMKGLADHIHGLGLKAGLYSSPGPLTCGGCVASYQHENQDAAQYATWGFDFLKYDWCTYGKISGQGGLTGLAAQKKPYQVMQTALAATGRDILYSFCQYGMGDVWKWGTETGGNTWRTTGDIQDSWNLMTRNASRQIGLSQYAGPGHWNDPDMLVVGVVGGWNAQPHASRLTPDEQYFHISMWALQGAPLLLGCDLTKLDPFTLGLLTNDEVNDVDQDPLGKVAEVVANGDEESLIKIWTRPLEDGSLAVGLFNYSNKTETGSIRWADLKISGPHIVRDLWRQKDLGTFPDKFESEVPAHGVVLVRIFAPAH